MALSRWGRRNLGERLVKSRVRKSSPNREKATSRLLPVAFRSAARSGPDRLGQGAGKGDETTMVGQRHARLDPAVAVDRHRRPADDAQLRPDRGPGRSRSRWRRAGGRRGRDRPRSARPSTGPARRLRPRSSPRRGRSRSSRRTSSANDLASVDGSPHGQASACRRGRGESSTSNSLGEKTALRLAPLPGLVGALLRGPERPVQPVPGRARLERGPLGGGEDPLDEPGVQPAEAGLGVGQIDDVVSHAHVRAGPRSGRAPCRRGGRGPGRPGRATRAGPAARCAARRGGSRS